MSSHNAIKPRLTFWQIWNMSFGFLGIQFGFALQNANVSRIFQTLGADIGNLSILWLAAPCTGLLVQPIIGHYQRQDMASLVGPAPALFSHGFHSLRQRALPDASGRRTFVEWGSARSDRRRFSDDYGRLHQYFNGALPGTLWRTNRSFRIPSGPLGFCDADLH